MARGVSDDIELKRAREREQKKQARASAALIQIPDCADRERRERLESDDIEWLMWYFGDGCGLDDPFTYRFTAQQREMIAAIRHAIKFGGDQAIAASRGEGKALSLPTLLATPSGWVTMRDVKVGDTLLDENHCSCTVTFATDVMHDHQCCKLQFSDGSTIVADVDHLWLVVDAADGVEKLVTTEFIKNSQRSLYTDECWFTRFSIRTKYGPVEILHVADYGTEPVRCIQVDSPSHLYLAGPGMVPTHNTTLSERLLLKCALTGEVNYTVLFAASGQMADNSIDALRQAIAENDRLADDYPEVCVPVRELENTPQRANTQKASGNRHDNGEPYEMAELHYTWCGQELIFPKTPGSPSAGSIIATRGLDAAVRGLKKRGKRPKLALIDDPDTEDTSRSEEQADKLSRRIDAAIGGLGGQKRGIGRVLLTTLQSRIAVSYRYTDPKQKPSFKGRRYRYLITPPNRMDLWDEYVMMRQEDLQQRDEHGTDLDPHCRRSHNFYATRKDEMDAGAVVSNENRYDPTLLPDGSQTELSALQHYFNEVARIGPEAVATELDNNPPEETAVVESGITPHRIQKQVSGLPRKMIPNGCTVLTQGIDVRKVALHWVVRAWKPDGTGYVVDYGIHEVVGTTYGSDEGVDAAVTKAIIARMTELKETDYRTEEGGVIPVDLTLVDAGWRTDAVYAACLKIGTGIMPIMGFGKSSGCTQANFHDHFKRTADKKPGDGWFMSRKGNIWLVCSDADRWKAWEHDRWMTSPDKAGCLFVWGIPHEDPSRVSSDQKGHIGYAHHITNEREVEEPIRGQLVRKWKLKSDNNHYLDASCYANVAANMRGVRIASSRAAIAESVKQRVDPMNRPSLRQLAGR